MNNEITKTYNYYIAFLCDLMVIDLPKLKYHYKNKYYDAYGKDIEPFKLRPSAKATTVPNEYAIYIDLEKFKDEIDLYLSLAHEVRHCAQLQSMYDNKLAEDVAPFESVQQWKLEFNGFNASNVEGYENQSIELDANAFAWWIGRVVFNVEMTVNCNQILLYQYKKYISEYYSESEIKECVKYSGFQYSKIQA